MILKGGGKKSIFSTKTTRDLILVVQNLNDLSSLVRVAKITHRNMSSIWIFST